MAKFRFRTAEREVKENVTTPKRAIFAVLASILLLFGIAGMLIPLVPGRILAAPGILLFSMYSPTVYALLKRKSAGHPKLQSRFDRVRNWLIRRIH